MTRDELRTWVNEVAGISIGEDGSLLHVEPNEPNADGSRFAGARMRSIGEQDLVNVINATIKLCRETAINSYIQTMQASEIDDTFNAMVIK